MENSEEYSRLDLRFDELWTLLRSITGPGLRKSLNILKKDIPLNIEGIETGKSIFDWEIPPEWRTREARLTGPDGEIYADLEDTNLSIVNYSEPVDKYLTRDELEPHLYSLPDLPDARPYVTSYYERNWGFCLPHNLYESLPDGEYHAYIDSEFVDGELNYGHAILDGETDREVLLSANVCHPSLANNELSGPLVLTSLYNRLVKWDCRQFTYRFVLIPETIGSLAYLSRYGEHLQDVLVGGLVLTCLGGPKEHLSYKMTRAEDARIDETVGHLDRYSNVDFRFRRFDPTSGSDERQYCSPGFNLPIGQFARTVYNQYKEYHNSRDDKEFMGINNIVESADIIERVLKSFEYNRMYVNKEPYGEPMLSKRELYPTVNHPNTHDDTDFLDKVMMMLNYSDGSYSSVEIAERGSWSLESMFSVIDSLQNVDLLE